MRITGGQARGIPLKTGPGDRVRPATDRTREAVFSRLGPTVEGAVVLDLFAGTGSYGLEALSRGAAWATFVESDRRALGMLRANIDAVAKSCGFPAGERARVIARDVLRLEAPSPIPGLIFADPPYALAETSLDRVLEATGQIVGAEGNPLLVVETGGEVPIPEAGGWTVERRWEAKRGDPAITFLRRAGQEAG